MEKYHSYYFLYFAAIILLGISTFNYCQNNLEVKLNKVNAWADFMPGSVHTFHVTGKFEIVSSDTASVSNIILDSVYVFQAGEKIYSFIPDVSKINKTYQNNSHSGYGINYSFGNKETLKLKKDLMLDKKIYLELVFHLKDKRYSYQSKEIGIKKTY